MKKITKSIVCMAIVTIALSVICCHFHGFAPCESHYYEQQMEGLTDWLPVFIVIGFFIGFLPAFIHESIKDLRPAAQANNTAAEQEPATSAPILYVGQVFTSQGSNCTLRVKAIKPIIIQLSADNNILQAA